MISITSKFGTSEGVVFQESKNSVFRLFQPRVTKTPTLDGFAVYDHRGMVTADREFTIRAINLTESQTAALQTILENETYVNLATDEAFFEGVIQRAVMENGELTMIFWVYEPVETASGSTKRMYVHEDITMTENITMAVS